MELPEHGPHAPLKPTPARPTNTNQETAMAHVLDPASLRDEADYRAALDELDAVMLCDPDTPAGCRFDELTALIADYEARVRKSCAPTANYRSAV
jgi:hypothetical protein